jgi:CHAT domain-containing protein/tetratricopeptide (TPR) repeat protein
MIRRAKYQLTISVFPVCLSAIAALGLVSVGAQEQTERAPLNPDAPVTARLNKGETHRYPLMLTAGQYAQVEAKALSGDVTLELTAPDGKKLMKMKARNGIPEGNSVVAVAEEAASYFVKITSMDQEKDGVEYQVRISELRPAKDADKARCQGEHLFAAGEEIYDQRTKEGYLASIEKYQAALPYYEKAEDWFGAARAVETMGEAYYYLANYRDALSAFEQSLPIVRKAEQTTKALSLEAKITSNIGTIVGTQNNNQKALYHYLQALSIYRHLSNRLSEAICLTNIGNIYTIIGQSEESLQWYEQALSIYRELDSDKRRVASILNSRGVAEYSQGRYLQAIEDQKASLELWRKLSNTGKQGWTLSLLAANHIELQQPQTALELLNDALPLIRKGGDRLNEAYALHWLGDVYRLFGKADEAIEYYQQALDLSQPMNRKILDAFSSSKIALTETLRDNFAEALFQSNRALDLVDQVREQYSNPLLGASYSSSTHHYYAEHIALLLKLHAQRPEAGYDVQAFQTSERAQARALLESLSDLGNSLRADLPATLVEREEGLQEAIDRILSERDKKVRETASPTRSARLQEIENELGQLTTQMDVLQGQIRASHPRYAALLGPKPLNLAEIQHQLLSPDSLLLEYFVAEDRLYLFTLTSESEKALQVFEIPDKAAIEKATEFFQRKKFESAGEMKRRFSYQNQEFAKNVQFLSDKLLAPVKSLLQKRKIWIVSDGGLQRIPFAALPDPRKTSAATTTSPGRGATRRSSITPLIVEHELVTLPSASTVAWLRKALATRPTATGGIAVVADPVFSASDERVKDVAPQLRPEPATMAQRFRGASDLKQALRGQGGETESGALDRLPASRDEAQAIARLAPERSLIVLDFDANRQMVMSGALNNYRYLHFATHAHVDDVFPGLSWLALSQVDRKGQEQPGYLRLNDIYRLRLNADLVTLGACRTGLGKQLRGEGMIGLTRGFIYAGAPRVMVSLWDVPDRETAQLMQSFYRNLLKQKLPVSEALRRAQVEMWERAGSNAPFFWAAFSLQGDPEK